MESFVEMLRNPLFVLLFASVLTVVGMFLDSRFITKKEYTQNSYIKSGLLTGLISSVIVYLITVENSEVSDLLDEPF
jgi:hypothetical protein